MKPHSRAELPSRIRFEIKERQGIWSVTKDMVFYGDYTAETDAEAAADSAVASIVTQGGRAVKIFAYS